jgi:hypothetical protein
VTERDPYETTNLDRYGHPPLEWSRVTGLLSAGVFFGRPTFLSTVRPDGRPHSAAVGTMYLDGAIFFTSGAGTRKARNLAADPACTLAAGLATVDLVLEGEAVRCVDAQLLALIAERCRADGWPIEVAGNAFSGPFSAPGAGPPPWQLYRFSWHTAFASATAAPHGATRWRFRR